MVDSGNSKISREEAIFNVVIHSAIPFCCVNSSFSFLFPQLLHDQPEMNIRIWKIFHTISN